ncbi:MULTISPECIES: hypothetical protein [Methylobacterium]|nr:MULTISPECIES: hypothetical protein [Methylobacterium]
MVSIDTATSSMPELRSGGIKNSGSGRELGIEDVRQQDTGRRGGLTRS